MRVFQLLLLVVLGVCSTFSQTGGDGWTTLATKDGAFSVDVPSDFISYKDSEKDEVRILASRPNSVFHVSFRRTSRAKFVTGSRKGLGADNAKSQSFAVGKYVVIFYTPENDIERFTAEIVSDSAFYRISVTAKSKDDVDISRFLTSCKLDGKELMKNAKIGPIDPAKVIYVNDLTTSPAITSALEHKQTVKIPVTNKYKGNKGAKPPDTIFYSRPLMILKKEFARYTDSARQSSISGDVELSVLFKGNGDIGEISVVKGLAGGLTESAINSAKRIKFLPAEIDGKPADVTKSFTYNFSIY